MSDGGAFRVSAVRLCADSSNTEPVWVKFGVESSTIEIPTTNPTNAMPILPGAIEVFSINPFGCWIHIISATAGQKIYVTGGCGE